jgi:hypothetical protein
MKNALEQHIANINEKGRAWVAEDPKNRFAGMLVEDRAHWAQYGITTPAEFDHYLLVTDVYEAINYKWGYKPNWKDLNAKSDEELREELESLAQA